ncbi:MAG: LTA synthase family protein [Erysipelotrichales bacterium]|nr:LTA synthase family protein [Erysipelotrichales bacterium]
MNVVFFAQICYAQQLGKFMIVSDLFLAGEGLQYVKSVFLNLNLGMLIVVIINIVLIALLNYINRGEIETKEKNVNKYIVLLFAFIIITTRCFSYLMLGRVVDSNNWQENYNTKNIYNNYTNPNSAMFVSGFYEYHVRAIYKYFYNLLTLDKTALKINVDKYNSIYSTNNTNNDYTGIFKDKSVIFIMMESIDSWIIDDETMPTLKYLMSTGMNFTNRYSPFFNGGQTINSEFALNTGMYAVSDKTTIYDIDDVEYPYSLANTLKNAGYNVNSFHANSGKFYNRTLFHQRLGYQNHYAALDMQKEGVLDNNINYYSDSEFISNDYLYNLFVRDEKFLTFFTTYSAHLEYTEHNRVFNAIEHNLDSKKYGQEEYIYRTLASDTDKFLSILLDKLAETRKLDDVIIVLATDHYVYGYSDPEYVALKKDTINNRKELQNTPFVIWSKDIRHEEIDTILDTADILPTLLNMLGISYNPSSYLGEDVFSDSHDNFVWFADGTYIADKNCQLSNEAILTKVNYNISKNKSILLTNYYGINK